MMPELPEASYFAGGLVIIFYLIELLLGIVFNKAARVGTAHIRWLTIYQYQYALFALKLMLPSLSTDTPGAFSVIPVAA